MPVSPKRPKGPPLNALRAFEAAARLGGFAHAAEELGVTPGAISQHIKALETWSGTALFKRRSQGVTLTAAGARILPEFTLAFDQIGQAMHTLRATTKRTNLQIAALPSVAQFWLSPRLPKIRAALPEIKLSVSAMEKPPNLDRELFDLSLFIKEPSNSPREIILAQDRIYPICGPEIAARLKGIADLENEVLLHDDSWSEDWTLWADLTGHDLPGLTEGPRYSLYSLALEEARNGAGVLIGHQCLVEDSLDKGQLVSPFPAPVDTGKALILEVARPLSATSYFERAVGLLKA